MLREMGVGTMTGGRQSIAKGIASRMGSKAESLACRPSPAGGWCVIDAQDKVPNVSPDQLEDKQNPSRNALPRPQPRRRQH